MQVACRRGSESRHWMRGQAAGRRAVSTAGVTRHGATWRTESKRGCVACGPQARAPGRKVRGAEHRNIIEPAVAIRGRRGGGPLRPAAGLMGGRLACVRRDGDGRTFFGRPVSLLDGGEASHLGFYRSSLIVRLRQHEPIATYLWLKNGRAGARVGVLLGIGFAAASLVADVATRHFGWPVAGFALVNVLVVAPLFEEVVFRGFFLRQLQDSQLAFWPANITAALMFLGLHLPAGTSSAGSSRQRQFWRSAFVSSGSSPDTPGGRLNRRGPASQCTSSTSL